MRTLETIVIQNFKSIRHQELRLGPLNVFIGSNGAGKSNLIQVFRLLGEVSQQNLAVYSLARRAENLLHFGPKVSRFMEFRLEFHEDDLSNGYRIQLAPTDEGSLVVSRETVTSHTRNTRDHPLERTLSTGSREAAIATSQDQIARHVRRDLDTYRLYHFHDTSESAPVKTAGPLEDNRVLRSDAANLAAFLYLLKRQHPDHFRIIEETVRRIAPFFDRFNLEPSRLSPDKIQLEWKERGSDSYFNAASISDGTLRFICLATLLMQPELPAIILLDEPELGLHPAAIVLLAEMLFSAATRAQVLVATQSVTLVNQFGPDDVWTVDREDKQSVFRRLAHDNLRVWMDEYQGYEGYGLGDLWEKNILGARP